MTNMAKAKQSAADDEDAFKAFGTEEEGGSSGFTSFGSGDDGDLSEEDGEGLTDLSGVSEQEYVPVPRGMYDVEIASMEAGKSNRSGNKMWTIVWETLEEVDSGKGKPAKRKFFYHLTFNEG